MEARRPFRIRYEAETIASAMSPAERMAGIDDLFETAIAMRRARFVREHPRATPQEVDAAVDAWLLERELESRLDERRIEGARRAAFLTRTEPR